MSEYPHFTPIDPAPEIASQDTNGFDINEYFFRLVSRQIDKLVIDGASLAHIRSTEHLDDNITRVICDGEDGQLHEFVYGIGSDAPVEHRIVDEKTS